MLPVSHFECILSQALVLPGYTLLINTYLSHSLASVLGSLSWHQYHNHFIQKDFHGAFSKPEIFCATSAWFLIVIYGLYLSIYANDSCRPAVRYLLPVHRAKVFPSRHCSPPATTRKPHFPFLVGVAATVTEIWIQLYSFVLSCPPYFFSYLII